MQSDSSNTPAYRTIKSSEFQAKCLELMDEVAESGEEIVITKRGRPISRLVPYREKQDKREKSRDSDNTEKPKTLLGIYRGKIKFHGDIVAPMPAEWFTDGDTSKERQP